ncbi:MAG: type II toxin-antitoxin system PemK/MazF family toxin [Lachnospiraceae bacterium]|nr:type II toxin-antitoxin system PemK/MazF family toxin [Lachnospiraceae bacterium]
MSEKWQEDNRKEITEIENSSSEEALKAPYYNRMDIVVVDFGDIKGDCLLRKRRPAIVLSRTEYNEHSPIMQVAPMTKSRKGLHKKYHVFIHQQYCNNLRGSGMCMLEQSRPIDRRQVVHKIGRINSKKLIHEIAQAVSYVNGLEDVSGLE